MSNPKTGEEFEVVTDETNQTYYVNLKTGNSQWNDPSELHENTVDVDINETAAQLFEEEEEEAHEEVRGCCAMQWCDMGTEKHLQCGV